MRVLELFSGTASFTKVCRARGHDCRTVDRDISFWPDIHMDVLDFAPAILGKWQPHIVWASPPCECFSTNTIKDYWQKGTYEPKNKKAQHALRLVAHTLELITAMRPRWYVIENPRAMLRKMPIMNGWPRKTVTYCQYANPGTPLNDRRMKPTDLWTNVEFDARCCEYHAPCHRPTQRGDYANRQPYEVLAVVPRKLCEEIIIACETGG